MPVIITEVGSANPITSTYYERKRRVTQVTPKTFRDRGIFWDLPYSFEKTGFRQSLSPMKLYGSQPSQYRDMSIVGAGMSRQYSTVPAFPDESKVIAKLADKWRNTDLNIGMYLSPEGRESVEMISGSLLRIANSARQLKRGDFGGAMRSLNHLPRSARQRSFKKFEQGDISGSFLAAHLGWEPLIKDIYAASEGVDPVETGKRIKSSSLGKRGVAYVNEKPFGAVVPCTKSFVDLRRLTYMGDISRAPTFQQRFGLGNPFQIAWELASLSFVADYFLPIGSVIDSMYFISQARFSALWRKTYSQSTAEVSVPRGALVIKDQYNRPVWNTEAIRRTEYTTMFTRSPHVLSFADPLRSLQVTMPSSMMKLATLTSLTHQRLLSLNRR